MNRQRCFVDERDYQLYIGLLQEFAGPSACSIHAFALMPNHVHLLVTPQDATGAANLMKAVGERYSQHFNRAHARVGTLWEGRFRSSLVDSADYLLQCYRYIELNPVRACLVQRPGEWSWSSFRVNALGEGSTWITPHDSYLHLGPTDDERRMAYLAWVTAGVSCEELEAIRAAIQSGRAFGSEGFVRETEGRLGQRARVLKRGRPRLGASVPMTTCLVQATKGSVPFFARKRGLSPV